MRGIARWLGLVMVASLLPACSKPQSPVPGWPRLLVRSLGEGGMFEWVVDEQGTYRHTLTRRPSYEEPPIQHRCSGTVAARDVAPLFERVRGLGLTADPEQAARALQQVDGKRPGATLLYWVDYDHDLRPANASAYRELDALASEIAAAPPRGSDEQCETRSN